MNSSDARNQRLADTVQAEIAKAGSSPGPARLFSTIRPWLEGAQAGLQADLKVVEGTMTPEQWRQVPERIRNPRQGFGGGPQGGLPRRRGCHPERRKRFGYHPERSKEAGPWGRNDEGAA